MGDVFVSVPITIVTDLTPIEVVPLTDVVFSTSLVVTTMVHVSPLMWH